MTKALLIGLLIMVGTTATEPVAAEPNNRILMIVRDDSRDQDLMLEQEVFVMQELIKKAGYDIDVATVTDQPLTGNVTLEPNIQLSEIDFSNYDGLILPCMAAEPQKAMPEKVLPIIKRARDQGLPIGAMRGSVRELARAGALDGHRYSYAAQVDLDEHPEFRNATFEGTGVTTDRMITTAGICPLAAKVLGGTDATSQLTTAFIETVAQHQPEQGYTK